MASQWSRCVLVGALKVLKDVFFCIEGSSSNGSDLQKKGHISLFGPEDPPDRVDWRERGAVTPIRDQKQCKACWAVAPAGSVETLHHTETGQLVELSVQEILDCDIHANGCAGGGNRDSAFSYISRFGLTSEELHPFVPEDYDPGEPLPSLLSRLQKCQKFREPVARIWTYKEVDTTDEALQRAVAINPVTVSLHVNEQLEGYTGGIVKIKNCPPPTTAEVSDPNFRTHAVLVIGYDDGFDDPDSDENSDGSNDSLDASSDDSDDGSNDNSDDSIDDSPNGSSDRKKRKKRKKYWIIKNSWGTEWGEGGYGRLERGTANPLGTCGIHRMPGIYPIGYLYPAPSRFESYLMQLVDICPPLRALIVWNTANDLHGVVIPKRVIYSSGPFGTFLLDLLRGKNCSHALLDTYLEGHVSSSQESETVKSAVGTCSWRLMSTLDNLKKNAFVSHVNSLYGSSTSCGFRVPDQMSEKLGLEYLHPEATFHNDVVFDSAPLVTKNNKGIGYNNDFASALRLADKSETSKLYLHPVNETAAAAAAQLTQRFMRKDNCLFAATSSHITHPCFLLMSRFCHSDNVNGILYQHQWNTSRFLPVSSSPWLP